MKKCDWWIDVYKYPIRQEFGNNDQIEEHTTYLQPRYFEQICLDLMFNCKESLVDLLARVSKLFIHEVDAALYTGHHRSRRVWKVFSLFNVFDPLRKLQCTLVSDSPLKHKDELFQLECESFVLKRRSRRLPPVLFSSTAVLEISPFNVQDLKYSVRERTCSVRGAKVEVDGGLVRRGWGCSSNGLTLGREEMLMRSRKGGRRRTNIAKRRHTAIVPVLCQNRNVNRRITLLYSCCQNETVHTRRGWLSPIN